MSKDNWLTYESSAEAAPAVFFVKKLLIMNLICQTIA